MFSSGSPPLRFGIGLRPFTYWIIQYDHQSALNFSVDPNWTILQGIHISFFSIFVCSVLSILLPNDWTGGEYVRPFNLSSALCPKQQLSPEDDPHSPPPELSCTAHPPLSILFQKPYDNVKHVLRKIFPESHFNNHWSFVEFLHSVNMNTCYLIINI